MHRFNISIIPNSYWTGISWSDVLSVRTTSFPLSLLSPSLSLNSLEPCPTSRFHEKYALCLLYILFPHSTVVGVIASTCVRLFILAWMLFMANYGRLVEGMIKCSNCTRNFFAFDVLEIKIVINWMWIINSHERKYIYSKCIALNLLVSYFAYAPLPNVNSGNRWISGIDG